MLRAALVFALGLWGFLSAPIESRGALAEGSCQWALSTDDLGLIWDPRHIVFFVVLTLIAAPIRRWRDGLPALLALTAYGVAVELSQSIFARGHCRIWDVAANLVGVFIAFAASIVWWTLRSRVLRHRMER